MIILCDMIESTEGKLKFERIYEIYKNLMYAVAFDVTKNPHDAEDVVEEALIKIIKILNEIAEESIGTPKCKNLIITITKNLAIDYWRKEKRLPEPMDELEIQGRCGDVEVWYIDTENYQEVVACINELDDKYLDILTLKVLHHLSSKQIAKILNISEINVNMRFMRAKKELVKKLEERNKR